MTRLLLLLPLLSACAYARRTANHPDGTQTAQTYVQVGGKGGYVATADGFIVQTDLEKSFRDAMIAGTVIAGGIMSASVEKAKDASAAATAQQQTKATAATEQARIKATERAATTLGSNPDANVGAINAVGNLAQ